MVEKETTPSPIEERIIAKIGAKKFEELKSEYAPRPLSVIEVEDKIALLRPITSRELANYSVMSAKEEGLEEANRYLLSELMVAGDSEIVDDEEYFMPAMLQVLNVIEVKKSSFTRL